jgi:hypothetical protein
LLSNFAFNLNLRRYASEATKDLPNVRDALNDRNSTTTFFAPTDDCIQKFSEWAGSLHSFSDCLLKVHLHLTVYSYQCIQWARVLHSVPDCLLIVRQCTRARGFHSSTSQVNLSRFCH